MNCITVITTVEGIEKTKTEKKNKIKQQQNSLKNISFTNVVRK